MNGYNPAVLARSYLQNEISHANPVQLVVMLYGGAIQRIREAAHAMATKQQLAAGIAIYRALAIIAELRKALNFTEGREVAEQLDGLYSYMHGELVRANEDHKADRLNGVLNILTELHGVWSQVATQVAALLRGEPERSPPPQEGSVPSGKPPQVPRVAVKA